jgi:hypothetical protein
MVARVPLMHSTLPFWLVGAVIAGGFKEVASNKKKLQRALLMQSSPPWLTRTAQPISSGY